MTTEQERLLGEIHAQRAILARAQETAGITREADEALRVRGVQLLALVDQLPIIAYAAPISASHVTFMSPQIQNLVGVTAEEWIADGDIFLRLLHPDDRTATLTALLKFYATGTPYALEFRFIRPDGRTVWVQDRAVIVRDQFGRPLFRQGVAQDVTARTRSEALVAAQARTLERVIEGDSLPSVLVTLVEGIETQRPEMLCSVLLLDPSGTQLLQGAAPSLPDAYNRLIHGLPIGTGQGSCGTAAAEGRRVIVTDVMTDPLWVSFRDIAARHGLRACWSEPIRSSRGAVLGTFAMYYREPRAPDADALALIEHAAKLAGIVIEAERTRTALSDSEERMRLAMESANMGTWTFDFRTQQSYASDRLLALLGLPPGSQPASTGEMLARVQPEDVEPAQQRLLECIRERRDFRADMRVLSPEGAVHWINAFGKIHYADSGEPERLYGVALDVTENRRLTEQLLRSQKMEAIGRLAGGIAHDFNNLMTAVVGYTEMIRLKAPPSEAIFSSLDQIDRAAHRAADLTRQLLAFARKQAVEPRTFDCNDLIGEMDNLLRRLIGEHIVLVIEPAAEPAFVRADPGQIEQVLVNLSVNARDAMPGGGRLVIAAKLEREPAPADITDPEDPIPDERVVIEVRDTGVGMSRQVVEHLFEPFFTTKSVGEGTGLGLATCYGIIRQAGGAISVRSEPGDGSVFRIVLPLAARPEAAAAKPDARAEAAERGAETILLAEDDPLVRDVTAETLRGQGYRIILAENGLEAISLARQHAGPIHLLVTDIVMPHVGGWELAERLTRSRPGLRVLYVSGYVDDPAFREDRWSTGREFLSKPFSPAELARRVRALLDTA